MLIVCIRNITILAFKIEIVQLYATRNCHKKHLLKQLLICITDLIILLIILVLRSLQIWMHFFKFNYMI